MRKVIPFLVILLIFASVASGQTVHGARAQGLGGAFSAVSDDPSALSWNPAGLSLFEHNAVISHYTPMYVDFCPDALGTGFIGYVHHFPGLLSVGVSGDMLYSDIYGRNIIGLNASKQLFKEWMYVGVRTNLLFSGYDKNNFFYVDDDDLNDPFFDAYGYNKNSFGLDLGAIAQPYKDWSFGLNINNLIPPNLHFGDDDPSTKPLRFRLGASYTYHDRYIFSAESRLSSRPLAGKAFNYYLGAETWQLDNSVGLRAGFNPDQLSFGATYRRPSFNFFSVSYAFIYPISNVGKEGVFSHKLSLTVGYKPEEEPVVVVVDTPEVVEPVIPPEPEAKIIVSPAVLNIAEVSQKFENELLVPLVFFDINSADVDNRFNSLLQTIGERVANNKNVELEVYGYYDPRSEENRNNLALRRAEAVRDRMVSLLPSAASRVKVIKDGYEFDSERAGLGRKAPTEQQQRMINHENRRAQFQLNLVGMEDTEFAWEQTPPGQVADVYNPLLLKNPDIDVIIEAGGTMDKLHDAFDYEGKLKANLPEERQDKVFVSQWAGGKGQIKLDGSSIKYRPKKLRSALDFSNLGTSIVEIEAEVPGGFESYSVDVIDLEGNVFTTLSEGKGLPPDRFEWDWRNEEGNLVDTREKYLAKLYGIDTLGRELTVYSDDTFRVNITRREKVHSRLLIVQFLYDRPAAQAAYLEDRLEYVTRQLLDFAREPDKILNVTITGHTDILGTERRNVELAEERAETEYKNIRVYLKAILGMRNDEELDTWLEDHNVNLSYEGHGPFKPYEVTRWEGGEKKEVMRGDDSLPEGRTVNRRVMIDMELIKNK